ncbi:MAG: CDP-alcohol phosphatidyltransferase family protein [Clostridia bacterium]|nr:CDP-alcohol phosphatidyltransferase family protein [Clostridia bacterium]
MKDLFKGCWTVPNLLSVIRIVLIPFFAYYFLKGDALAAILILFFSGVSDFLDGKIARKFNQVSALGKVLDPVADKFTQITLAVLLFMSFNKAADQTLKAFSWVFLVFIVKEAIMVLFGGFMILLGLRPSAAEIFGKVSTFAFYAIMLFIVAFGPEVGLLKNVFQIPATVMIVLVVISAILTLLAFVSYFPDTFRKFKERSENKKQK